ncbi:MAG: hypothetical protein M1820_008636 [Bogoriella megaspora]|nr:MAG: hypothetical protein M1820_008636 [Bogoriella megaspora]
MGDLRHTRHIRGSTSAPKRPNSNQLPNLMDQLNIAPTTAFVRSSSSTLSAIQELDDSEYIVLFTPAIIPPKASQSSTQATTSTPSPVDPFEAFGRALASRHRRIRHVPYLPSQGFTTTHDGFIPGAGAIVILIWGPTADTNTTFLTATASQRAFIDAVAARARPRSKSGTPVVLFITGTSKPNLIERDLADKFKPFDTIIHSQLYNQVTLHQTVDLIYQMS